MVWYIDPELRRTLLTEIAFQRYERSRFRRAADDEAEPYGVQVKARMRADGCNRAIRALRDVWAAAAETERERARVRLSAAPINGTWLAHFEDLVPAGGLSPLEERWLGGDR
jgi:hypothetical protein